MCISTDILWRGFQILTKPLPYTFVKNFVSITINGENNEARVHIAVWARALLFRRLMDTNVCGTGTVKIWKTRHKMSVDIFTVYRL